MSSALFDDGGPTTATIAEAAELLRCGKSTLYDRARVAGELVPGLPFVRIGSAIRLPRQRLIDYATGAWTPDEHKAAS